MKRKRLKPKHEKRFFKILLIAIAIIMFWWGVWGILDHYININNPMIGYVLGIIIALAILYFDDFHLKELE